MSRKGFNVNYVALRLHVAIHWQGIIGHILAKNHINVILARRLLPDQVTLHVIWEKFTIEIKSTKFIIFFTMIVNCEFLLKKIIDQ